MRRARSLLFLVMLSSSLWAGQAAADFNPRGRQRQKPTVPSAGAKAGRASGKRPAPKPKSKSPPKAPSSETLIQRYTGIVLKQPGAQFPLERLAQLYRERDGNLDQLLSQFESRIGQGNQIEQYNSLVALAGLYKQAGRNEQAIERFRQAVNAAPNNPTAMLALARLHQDGGAPEKAKQLLDQALPFLRASSEKEQTIRRLMTLSIELGDIPAARQYHKQLLTRAKGSFFVRAELGRELLSRELYQQAEPEFRSLVKAATGDNRALASAFRDLGLSLAKQDKHEEALVTLRRGLKLTARGSGLRRELLNIIVGVYRNQEQLPELVALLEAERASDFQQLRLLGGLYEESGRIRDAMKTYRKALKKNSKDLEVRLKLVQLLQIQGALAEAITEYKALIKAAPHNPDYVFQLAEALLQQGKRAAALKQLLALERRSKGDEQTLAALVDFYDRVGEPKRGFSLLERLAQGGSRDPQPVLELGDRYFQEGDAEKAKKMWQRLLVLVPNRAKAWSMLGDVYLEHDLGTEALAAFEQALKLAPRVRRYKKSLALALERSASGLNRRNKRIQYDKARKLWESLLAEALPGDRIAQEARQHIVTLWNLAGTMQMRIAPLRRNLSASPPDLNAGRLLAEIFTRKRQYHQAEQALRIVTGNAPGDIQSFVRLERVLVLQRKLKEAIDVLKKLTSLEPKRARVYYQRMAQYAAELYLDDDAIRFASKALELSPDDAVGHQKLGDMYRRRQDTSRAVGEYRKAIAKNDRLFPVYFDLAELLLSQQKTKDADLLLRRVMRAAADEDLIMRATRLSMQINLGRDSLESLEKELLPIALANPRKPIYRRLLVEIYGALAFPLTQKARSHDAAQRSAAHAALARIGRRAVKPLLDALGDERESQQRVSVELLTHLANKSASAALFSFAVGDRDASLRVRAMLAAGVAQDSELLGKYEELLFDNRGARVDDGDPVSLAAVWGLVQLQGRAAQKRQRQLLESESESTRALAAIALGRAGVRAAEKPLLKLLDSIEYGHLSRAAACFALGELKSQAAKSRLLRLSEGDDQRVRSAALVALTRIAPTEAARAVATALVSNSAQLRTAALGATAILGGKAYKSAGDPLGVPKNRVRVETMLQALVPEQGTSATNAKALITLKSELLTASRAAVRSSIQGARLVAELLMSSGGFGPLTDDLQSVPGELRQRTQQAKAEIHAGLVPAFLNLAEDPSPASRIVALGFLALRPEEQAQDAVAMALHDMDPQIQRAAIALAGKYGELQTARGLVELLGSDQPWPVRMLVAETLAAYRVQPSFQGSAERVKAIQALDSLARQDPYALVREAATKSVAAIAGPAATKLLEGLARQDDEPRVRETAKRLLESLNP